MTNILNSVTNPKIIKNNFFRIIIENVLSIKVFCLNSIVTFLITLYQQVLNLQSKEFFSIRKILEISKRCRILAVRNKTSIKLRLLNCQILLSWKNKQNISNRMIINGTNFPKKINSSHINLIVLIRLATSSKSKESICIHLKIW